MISRALGLYYPQNHNILKNSTQDFCAGLTSCGCEAEVVNVSTEDGLNYLLSRLKDGGISFCFGLQGIGSNLTKAEQNLWAAYKTPFLGLHFDHPCHNPYNHVNPSPYVGNFYYYNCFLEARRDYFDIPQMTGRLPFDTCRPPPHTQSQLIDFDKRPIKFLYLKNGGDIEKCIATIEHMPKQVGEAVWQQIKRTRRDPDLSLCELTEEIFKALGYDRHTHEPQFWGVVQAMDVYIRTKRSIDFVNWLKYQKGAIIFGEGWDIIDKSDAQAEFRSSLNAAQAYTALYHTQFVCNINPYGSDIQHERTINGLLNNCCVLSDSNTWWNQHFANVPALKCFDWTQSLEDQLRLVIDDVQSAAEACGSGFKKAEQYFTGRKSFSMIIDYASQLKEWARLRS